MFSNIPAVVQVSCKYLSMAHNMSLPFPTVSVEWVAYLRSAAHNVSGGSQSFVMQCLVSPNAPPTVCLPSKYRSKTWPFTFTTRYCGNNGVDLEEDIEV